MNLGERLVIAFERIAAAAEVAASAHAQLASVASHLAQHGVTARPPDANAYEANDLGTWRIEFDRE